MRACEAVLQDCMDANVNVYLTDAHLVSGRANKRLFLLDYDGTLIPCSSINSRPTAEVLAVLKALVADPRNVVYIISGRGRSELGDWFESVVRQHRPVVSTVRWFCALINFRLCGCSSGAGGQLRLILYINSGCQRLVHVVSTNLLSCGMLHRQRAYCGA